MLNQATQAARAQIKAEHRVRIPHPDIMQARIIYLSTLRSLTFAERAELAALCIVQARGGIGASEVWKILLGFHCKPQDAPFGGERGDGWLDEVDADMVAAWRNLLEQNAGHAIPRVPSPVMYPNVTDAHAARRAEQADQRTLRWLWEVMHQTNVYLVRGLLFPGNVIDLLPDEVISTLYDRLATDAESL